MLICNIVLLSFCFNISGVSMNPIKKILTLNDYIFVSVLQSYRYFPSNIEIIEWLGAYYIESQFCEKAISYFERASIIQ